MREQTILPFDREYLTNTAKSAGFELNNKQLELFERYYNELLEYNQKVNLTAITDPHGVAVTHFVDSLTLLRADIKEGAKMADIGAGAGFPSVPARIFRPDIELTLIDSLNKRITFLNYLSEKLSIPITALHARAEEAGRQKGLREQFDVVCARGVAKIYLLCEYCLPLLKVGGKLVLMKGPEPEEEIKEAKKALSELCGKVIKVDKFTLPDQSGRSLVIIEKTSTTPAKYPRQSAKISKSPLI
ncbi:MAG: 16S rRNA (guanine(527)-N(7))-methyltransferase RsmG [Oscillospiraceae bacterium]|nr:16S rRNA (guanine(527)-N(7))-methyltransferase RsmG [Oscillospiraceae bacterium]